MGRMNSLLSRIHLPKVNNIIERGRLEKAVDFELIGNKYKNLNINSILGKEASANPKGDKGSSNEDNLNKLLYNIYYKTILTNSVLPDSQGGEASSDPAGNSSRGAKSHGVASSNK